MSAPEIIASIAGALCVYLLARQNIWTFPTGIVQVIISAWVFYQDRLFSDAILQIFFFVLNVYGWVHWTRGDLRRKAELPVSRMTARAIAGWVIAVILLTAAWGTFAKVQLNAAAPYADGFILVASLAAQWLTARKYLESWWLWIIVDAVAVPLYASRGLYAFAVLYAVYFVLCVQGVREWRQSIPAAPAAASV